MSETAYLSALLTEIEARLRQVGATEADFQASVPWTQGHVAHLAGLFGGPPQFDHFDLAAEFLAD